MKKNILLTIIFSVLFCTVSNAQTKPAPVKTPLKPAPATPKVTPYVLKKEYEPQVQEMNAKINSALGSANAVRREIAGKFDRIEYLDSQLRHIEEILNSASFQIALTSDSLKEAKFDMEAFKKQTEQQMDEVRKKNDETSTFTWTLFGISILLLAIAVAVLLMKNAKLKESMHVSTQHELQGLKMKLIDETKSQQQLLKDEIQALRSKMASDMNLTRSDVLGVVQKNKENTDAELQAIIDRMTTPDKTEEDQQ